MPSAFLIEWPGAGEILLILIVVLVLFGPKRLPEIARTIGGMLNTLRRASQDFHDHVMQIEESPPAIDAQSKELPPRRNGDERNATIQADSGLQALDPGQEGRNATTHEPEVKIHPSELEQ